MSYLSDYFLYTSDNEAPKIYHQWSAISSISALIGRKVWIQQGIFTFYPNLYVALVGGPGCGKTTAMSVAKNIVRDVGEIPICPTSVTKEKICETMSQEKPRNGKSNPCKKVFCLPGQNPEEYTQYAIFATEISHFLGVSSAHMVDFLTTIYDEVVYEAGTKHQGDDLIKGPYITLLGCLTPETTNNFLKANVIGGGFSRRCLFVLALERGAPIPEPKMSIEMLEARIRCIEWGRTLREVKGPFTWEPEAKTWYNEWYIALRNNKKLLNDPILGSYYESKHVQLLKTAMCVQLAVSTQTVLSLDVLHAALQMLDDTEITLPKVFSGVGRNEVHKIAMDILDFLQRQGKPMLKKAVIAMFHRDANVQELEGAINHLLMSDRVELKRRALREGTPMLEFLTATSALSGGEIKNPLTNWNALGSDYLPTAQPETDCAPMPRPVVLPFEDFPTISLEGVEESQDSEEP